MSEDLTSRQISHLESKIEDMSMQVESLRDDLNRRDDKITGLKTDLDENLKIVSKQKKRISDVLEETNERESQIVTLENQIETLNLTIETLKITIDTKSRALNEAEACILDVESSRGETVSLSSQHISDLETKNADLKVEMEVLQQDMFRRQNVAKDLRSEIQSLRSELKMNRECVSDEMRGLQDRNTDLEERNSKLQIENADLQGRNADLEERNSNLEDENTDLQDRNASLKVKNSNLQEMNFEIKQKSASEQEQQREELETANARLQKMFEELASQSKSSSELKQQLEKMESLHELEMKENEEETDALMGEVETLRVRLEKQKRTMLKQEESIESLKESRESSELEWKKRCKIMANRANQDMEKLKSMMNSKLEDASVTYRKDMKRLTRKFEEKQRKTVLAMKSSEDTKLEKLTRQRNKSWEKEKQTLVHTLNRALNEKNRLEREQEERVNVETKIHEILEGFRTLKLCGDKDSENQQLQCLRRELKKLQKENGLLSGHHNMQQRIHHVQNLKLENAELSRTVDALNEKISALERKLEVATTMMENTIVPTKGSEKWDRLASSNRENNGVSMKWKKKTESRKAKKTKKRKVLGRLQ